MTQINSKSLARIAAIQTIYQYSKISNNESIDQLINNMLEFYKDPDLNSDLDVDKKLKMKLSVNFFKELATLTHSNSQVLDNLVSQYLSSKWKIEDLSTLLGSIIKVGLCELKYFPEVSFKIVINEYTNIASTMLDEHEVGFVNSVLDKFAASLNSNH